MSFKILVVVALVLALALTPGAAQAKPHGKAKAPLAHAVTGDRDDEDDDDGPVAAPSAPVGNPVFIVDPDLLLPPFAPADVKPPTEVPPRPPGGTRPPPPPPPATPKPGKGHGRACRGRSRRKAGERQSPFKRCIEARKDKKARKLEPTVGEEREEPENDGAEDGAGEDRAPGAVGG